MPPGCSISCLVLVTALAGFFSFDPDRDPRPSCQAIGQAQWQNSPGQLSVAAAGSTAFARGLSPSLPEDRHDHQPLTGHGGRFLFVADVRLDNRRELAASLRNIGPRPENLSDADILLLAFEKWDEQILEHIVGDFAFAVYDIRRSRLILARDPAGQRPLHYHVGRDFAAFASMPTALHGIPDVPCQLNRLKLAEFLYGRATGGAQSYFAGIRRVLPGEVVTITAGGDTISRQYDYRPARLGLSTRADYAEAFRERLDQAVACRMRGVDGIVGAHLSSGLDSSAVVTSAAGLLQPEGQRVLAFTAAPRDRFESRLPDRYLADETALARTTAARFSNIEHIIVRSSGDPIEHLDQRVAAIEEPIGNVTNSEWGARINQGLQNRGVGVLLTGDFGNFALSAGGSQILPDLLRSGAWRQWGREARHLTATKHMRWSGVLAQSFGGWLPAPAWSLIERIAPPRGWAPQLPSLLRSEWQKAARQSTSVPIFSSQPHTDSQSLRMQALKYGWDVGNFRKATLATYGIEECDPTSDRRLIEFCLALPLDALLRDGIAHPLYNAAFGDRLPPEVLRSKQRGYQSADWYERYSRDRLIAEVERIRLDDRLFELIDYDRLLKLVEAWPRQPTGAEPVLDMGDELLRILSVASFLRSNPAAT